ncbi:MAG: flagellar assembly protein FliH [Gammaproteobacteria bacterium]|nr:flagellar assembly protein FliH [Gammaproteobacteria bacterium]
MSKIIPKEDLEGIENWSLPEVHMAGSREVAARPLTARQIEELQQQAREEGFQLGRREGLEAGKKEIRARVRELESLMQTLSKPLEQIDAQIENELVQLALAVAKQLVRRELKSDPGQVLAVVREAMAALPLAARNVRLHLHPKDAALVRDMLALGDNERGWQIVEDPLLARGGCKISSDTSQIDASVERRLHTVIANVLGGQRETDTDTESSAE